MGTEAEGTTASFRTPAWCCVGSGAHAPTTSVGRQAAKTCSQQGLTSAVRRQEAESLPVTPHIWNLQKTNLSNERHIPPRGCIQEGGGPILIVLGCVLSYKVAHTLQIGSRLHQQQPVSWAGSGKTMFVCWPAGAVCCVTCTLGEHVPAASAWQRSRTIATEERESMHAVSACWECPSPEGASQCLSFSGH